MFWKRFKKKLIARGDEMVCHWCGKKVNDPGDVYREFGDMKTLTKELATVDHVFPRSKGGTNDLDNLVISCFSCNAKKKDRT